MSKVREFFGAIPQDKVLHALCGSWAAAFVAIMWPQFGFLSIVGAAAAAAVKELWDETSSEGTGWSWEDFGATCIGGAVVEVIWIAAQFV